MFHRCYVSESEVIQQQHRLFEPWQSDHVVFAVRCPDEDRIRYDQVSAHTYVYNSRKFLGEASQCATLNELFTFRSIRVRTFESLTYDETYIQRSLQGAPIARIGDTRCQVYLVLYLRPAQRERRRIVFVSWTFCEQIRMSLKYYYKPIGSENFLVPCVGSRHSVNVKNFHAIQRLGQVKWLRS